MDMVDTVSTDDNRFDINPAETPAVDEQFSLEFAQPPASPETAADMAFKIDFGLSDVAGMPQGDIHREFALGNGETFLQRLAINKNVKNASDYEGRIKEAIRTGRLEEFLKKNPIPLDEDSATIVQRYYTKKFFDELIESSHAKPDSWWNQAELEVPETVQKALDLGGSLATKQQIIQMQRQKFSDLLQNQGFFSWLGDLAITAIPLATDYQQRANVPGTQPLQGGLLGGSYEEQRDALFTLPTGKFAIEVDRLAEHFRNRPMEGLAFFDAMAGQSSWDKFVNNAFTILDFSGIAQFARPIGRVTGRSLRATEVIDSIKGVVKATNVTPASKATVAEAIGDIPEAAVQKTKEGLINQNVLPDGPIVNRGLNPNPAAVNLIQQNTNLSKESYEALSRYLQVFSSNLESAPGRLSQAVVNRLKQNNDDLIERLREGLTTTNRVQALPEEVIRAYEQGIRDKYKGLHNSIMNVETLYDPIVTTHYVRMLIQQANGQLFRNKEQANTFLKFNELDKVGGVVKPKPHGSGYYIELVSPVNETDDIIRDGYREIKSMQLPRGFGNNIRLLPWTRTTDDTVSEFNRQNRKTATFNPNKFRKIDEDEAWFIKALRKGSTKVDPETGVPYGHFRSFFSKEGASDLWQQPPKSRLKDWNRLVDESRRMLDPVTKKPGYFFKTVEEIDDFYQRNFKRMPDDIEIAAYLAHARRVELDAILRETALYRGKARVGAKQHTVYVTGREGERIESLPFDGILQKDVPKGGNESLLFIGDGLDSIKLYNTSTMGTKQYSKFRKQVKEGELSVIRVYDPDIDPLKDFHPSLKDIRLRYIITKNFNSSPIKYEQLPRRGGGHFDWDFTHSVKQANVHFDKNTKMYTYNGDITFHFVNNAAVGRDYVKRLNQVTALLAKGKEAEAKALYTKLGLPQMDEFFDGFKLDKEGRSRFNPKEPFVVVPRDKMIIDLDTNLEKRYPEKFFRDGTKERSDAKEFQVKYTGERDSYEMFTLGVKGTQHNPIFFLEPARMVDPITSINRSLTSIINSTWLNDYKNFAIEEWLAQASKYLDVSPSMIKSSPYYAFYKGEFKTGASFEDQSIIDQLKANRFQIKQLIGIPSKFDTFLHSGVQAAVEGAYRIGGPKLAIDPHWLLPYIQNPFRAIRAFTHHIKLGLFAIPQLFVQNMTWVTVHAVAGPKYSMPAGTASLFHMWSLVNPNVIDTLDRYISNSVLRVPGFSHFKPGEFKESIAEFNRTGFGIVRGEHIRLDDIATSSQTKVGFHTFVDEGQFPYRWGEYMPRLGAWHAAFREFRDKFPLKKITEEDRMRLIDRADLFANNMSRASASSLHTGPLSLASQFLAFNMRLAELLTSGTGRTGQTLKERNLVRARLLGLYIGLFGAPVGVGVTGLPLGETIREFARETLDYVPGENVLSTFVMEGAVATAIALATGDGDIQKGQLYNVGPRFGTQGFEQIYEILRGDATWWSMAGGPSSSIAKNLWKNKDGLFFAVGSMIRGDFQGFPLKLQDFTDILKEVSSINTLERSLVEFNTGMWLSRNGNLVADNVGALENLFMSVTGLSRTEDDDAFGKGATVKERRQHRQKYEVKFMREFRRGLQEAANNNWEQAHDYYARAFKYLIAGGTPEEDFGRVYARALDEHKTIRDRVNWQYYVTQVPPEQRDKSLENWIREERLKQIKE